MTSLPAAVCLKSRKENRALQARAVSGRYTSSHGIGTDELCEKWGSFQPSYDTGVADVPDDDLVCDPRISANLED